VRDLSPVRAVRAQAPDPAQTHRHVTHGPTSPTTGCSRPASSIISCAALMGAWRCA